MTKIHELLHHTLRRAAASASHKYKFEQTPSKEFTSRGHKDATADGTWRINNTTPSLPGAQVPGSIRHNYA